MIDTDRVVQEPCVFGASMGDKRFLRAHFQTEFFPEERADFCFDLPCFGLRPRESEDKVVGIANIVQSAKVRVVYVMGGEFPSFLFQSLHRLKITLNSGFLDRVGVVAVLDVFPATLASGVFWNERLFDEGV
jgi:hypothetical protein